MFKVTSLKKEDLKECTFQPQISVMSYCKNKNIKPLFDIKIDQKENIKWKN